ncbi:MAG: SagB/ThcOx family dehydrogenase [Candidatus Altiarchaeota archaeon]
MNKKTIIIVVAVSFIAGFALFRFLEGIVPDSDAKMSGRQSVGEIISLPDPVKKGNVSVEEALSQRRSRREYSGRQLTLSELSQLLWAAQGVNERFGGKRTAPSAGATYPLELYAVVGGVDGLSPGVYHYLPGDHSIRLVSAVDARETLAAAALNQGFIAEAPVTLVLSAVYERTTETYGQRGIQYVHMEAGHAAQNVYLMCEALGLGTVAVGAFDDEAVMEVIGLSAGQRALYLLPVGGQS